MKTRSQTVGLLLITLMLYGCGGTAPSPTDADVKQLTLELCGQLLRDQLIILEGPNHTGITIVAMQTFNGIAPKYAAWNDAKEQDDGIRKTVEAVDATMRDLSLSLNAIRIISRDDDTKRTEFAAELLLGNGNKIDMEGSAQYTEDGQIYVEVVLLE